ncbi:hypothetical protein AB0G04_07840 [Actinoplanes sp. NPDC023801]|uniref:hypothetical protein n=1 Tax=Actinoplanes sp. NPDC023801 TaxID=3154595 RepID=UPI0033E4741C
MQRGLGRGAVGARRGHRDPATAATVMACLVRDHRWWWIDERATYLAAMDQLGRPRRPDRPRGGRPPAP